jgi:folate-binding protein YgfZ
MSQNPAATARPLHWIVENRDFDVLPSSVLAISLPSMSIIHVQGPDSASFLQGQLTVDTVRLAPDHLQLGGACDPKGRLLAIYYLWRHADDFYLVLPTDLAAGLAKRLAMYVLRAKARVQLHPDWSVHGILAGPQAPTPTLAAPVDGILADLGTTASGVRRWLSIGLHEANPTRHAAAPDTGAESLWWWSQIDAAHPMVFAASAGLFVPQAVNLEALGGVNFRKGCYTGQEVVARSQYLGKLRRRLHVGVANHLGESSDVFLADQSEPIGRLVLSAECAGRTHVMFECPSQAIDQQSVCAGTNDPACRIEIRALPYALVDPTA